MEAATAVRWAVEEAASHERKAEAHLDKFEVLVPERKVGCGAHACLLASPFYAVCALAGVLYLV